MSKIIKLNENVDFSVYTKFTKDLGLFQVKAERMEYGISRLHT